MASPSVSGWLELGGYDVTNKTIWFAVPILTLGIGLQTSLAEASTARPVVTSLSPARGTTHGLTRIVVRGQGFVRTSRVRFWTDRSSAYARRVTFVNPREVIAYSPAFRAAITHVEVSNAGGWSLPTRLNTFTFVYPSGGSGACPSGAICTSVTPSPKAVAGFTVGALNSSTVGLRWTDPSGINSVTICRMRTSALTSSNACSGGVAFKFAPGVTSFKDAGLAANGKYYYTAWASYSSGDYPTNPEWADTAYPNCTSYEDGSMVCSTNGPPPPPSAL